MTEIPAGIFSGSGKRRYDIIAIVALFAMAVILEYREAFSLIEDEAISYRQILRTHFADESLTAPHDDVVIVFTDEEFYEEYGVYPLRRVDLSTIIVRLAAMDASVIGVDMLLDFNSAYGEDPSLESALQEAGNVLLVSQAELEDGRYTGVNRAIPRFDDYTRSGYSNISPNSAISESISRLRVYPRIAEDGEWPFAVQAVANHLFAEPELTRNILSIGDEIAIELDHFGDIYIDYPLLPPDDEGEGGTVQLHDVIGLSASDLLFVDDEDELSDLAALIDGKIVLIGEVAEVAHDEFETPVGNVYGVEVIASTISTILRNAPLRAASFLTEATIAVSMFALLLLTLRVSNPLPRNLISVVLIGSFVGFATYVYVANGLVLSVSYIFLASVATVALINARFYISEMGQKAHIRSAFGQYLSPRVVEELVKDPSKLSLGGEEREMTAFFSDIAGFSTFSESMTPSELVQVLNDYLTEMCNIIIAAEGTVDKFEGDAIIAFWGAPGVQEDHARRACLAAIDMQHALKNLRQRWVSEGRPDISVRMGLSSGPMVVGNMGSAQRTNYTIMGDAVNLASRLEGANKAYGSGIMISEATYELCKDDVEVRHLDLLRVVGKNEPINVFEVMARIDEAQEPMRDLIRQFEAARTLYAARDYQGAMEAFELCTSIDANDGPSKVYIERCQQYIADPPAEDWDGVFTLFDKG